VAYIHSSEQAHGVAGARERALSKAEDALARVARGLGARHYKTRRQVDARVAKILTGPVEGLIKVATATRAGRPTLTFSRDQDAINAAARSDGIYALATNLTGRLSAGRVLELYKGQQIVERRHRDLKQTLKVRPIFLHNGPPPVSWSQVDVVVVAVRNRRLCTEFWRAPALVRARPSGSPAA
jgi:hypothetical protein